MDCFKTNAVSTKFTKFGVSLPILYNLNVGVTLEYIVSVKLVSRTFYLLASDFTCCLMTVS